MPKQTYQPTEADALTGQNVRRLRRAAGETLAETIERAGLSFSGQSMSRVELGQRQLTVPEATKLAAHFNTTAEQIIVKPIMDVHPSAREKYTSTPPSEQEWLGNPEPTPLFAVPDPVEQIEAPVAGFGRTLVIDLDNPPAPDEYRLTVWLPYLEARYSADTKAS